MKLTAAAKWSRLQPAFWSFARVIIWDLTYCPRSDRRRTAVLTAFVLDTSVTVAWRFEDQSTPYTDAVLQAIVAGSAAIIPAIWRLEVVNVLVVAERRKRITPEKSALFVRELQQLSITIDIDGIDHVFDIVFSHARRYQRSSYDASYLEVARRHELPFATRDEPLKKAAADLGIFEP